MMLRIATAFLFLLLLPHPVAATVAMDIQCNEAQSEFTFNVEIFNQFYLDEDSTGWEVIFEQSLVGGCEEPEVVMAVPLPVPLGFGYHTFTIEVPETNQYFLYTAKMKAPDGTIWVLDPFNFRVQQLDPELRYLSQFGQHGGFPFGIPVGRRTLGVIDRLVDDRRI